MSSRPSLEEQLPTPVTDLEKGPNASPDDDTEYPSGKKLALILSALYLAMFLVALDRTIIATAVPRITDQFHSVDDSEYSPGHFFLLEDHLDGGHMVSSQNMPAAPESSLIC